MDKPHNFNAERLKNLIAEDKLLQVLEELRGYAKGRDKDMYDELIIHLNNINTVRKERGMGLISFSEERAEKNRIVNRLNHLIDDLEKVYGKKRFIIEFEGKFEELNEEKQLNIKGGISQILKKSDIKIIGFYSGSIKVLIESQNIDTDGFKAYKRIYLYQYNADFEDTKIIKVVDENQISREIAKEFYILLSMTISPIPFIKERFFTNLTENLLQLTINKVEDFRGMDLGGANLRCVNLRGANLSGAYLVNANLTLADLSEANLSGADLREANLIHAFLNGTDLREADLSGADLREADLRGADLRGADLRTMLLVRANFSGADLSGLDLSNMHLIGMNLSGANLSGGDLNRVYLYGANLSGADLSGVNLSRADLENSKLSGATLSGANLSGANLSGIKVDLSDLLNAKTLYKCFNLEPSIKQIISLIKPELFEDPDDGKKEDVFTRR